MAPRKQRKSHSALRTNITSSTPPPYTSKSQTFPRKAVPQLYGEIQKAGAERQTWIEDPKDTTCAIKPSTLSVSKLKKQGWTFKTNIIYTPLKIEPGFAKQGFPKFKKYRDVELSKSELTKSSEHKHKEEWIKNSYCIILGEGIIYAKDIKRADGPPFSEIATALYTAGAPIESLKHVYFDNVVNADTRRFVEKRLYSAQKGLTWPPRRPIMVWKYDTAGYQGLLGTRLGKAVVYMVLGAFPRGTHYISKVVTFAGRAYGYALHLRFDIEPIPVGLGRLV
jgi:hypothetical protein